MRIAGFVKNSFVDYPQQIASVIFTNGCNYNCSYCHNHKLIDGKAGSIDEETCFQFLKQRIGKIDGVVITGGEPTIQSDLKEFIKKIKALGFLVKLDTNGSNPQVIEELLKDKLLDFVAMDIKAPKEKLKIVACAEEFFEKIEKSIQIIITSGVSHEFRTTVVPSLNLEDISSIVKMIKGAKSYALQKFNPVPGLNCAPYSKSFFEEALKIAQQIVPNSFLRGF
ncbi:MAG: anaerobic ribonucleoside-triphosphate reductase activating protein [Clostridia bacterium]